MQIIHIDKPVDVTNRRGETVVALTGDEVEAHHYFDRLLDLGHSCLVARERVALRHPLVTDEFLDWLCQ